MTQPEPPAAPLTWDASLSDYACASTTWLARHAKTWDGLATSALVYDASGRVLLLQRAPTDSMPLRWETPGGAVDAADATVLAGCARELFEEAGLRARRVRRAVAEGEGRAAGSVHTNRTGERFFCRFAFEVEVEAGEVRLDAEEHVDFVWATEGEVRSGRMGDGREIELTGVQMRNVLLEGFRLRRLDGEGVGVVRVSRGVEDRADASLGCSS